MGHYDSDYEHQDEEQRKVKLKEAQKFLKAVRKLRYELDDHIVSQRHIDHLEDLENELEVKVRVEYK